MKNHNRACEFAGYRGGADDVSHRPECETESAANTNANYTQNKSRTWKMHSLRLNYSCTLYERKRVCDELATASTEDLQRSDYDAVWFCRSEALLRGGILVQEKLKLKAVFLRNVSSYMPKHMASHTHTRKQIMKFNTKSHNGNVSISTYDC
jgi:hypothetical protein